VRPEKDFPGGFFANDGHLCYHNNEEFNRLVENGKKKVKEFLKKNFLPVPCFFS
jgi:hypothetical protein